MTSWAALDQELDLWHDAGQPPTFWWRDDDCTAPSPALDRLLALSETHAVPLHLAVIPARLSPDLASRLAAAPLARTLQHGLAHVNHEPKGYGASEMGAHRPVADIQRDLIAGREMIARAGLSKSLAAFAAPWNRIGPATLPVLAALGYRLVSRSGPRATRHPAPGLTELNIHVDPIRWKDGAQFRGEAKTLHNLIEHLQQKRLGEVDPTEATGLNTHHLQTDAPTWTFLERLMQVLAPPRGQWLCLDDVLAADHG